MTEHEGKVAMQVGPRGLYARVWVRLLPPGGNDSVTISQAAHDTCYAEQGWLDAARKGALLGLKFAGATSSAASCCEVVRIHGMVADTNPTLVAIATILAVWKALGFAPSAELSSKVQELTLRCREFVPDQLDAQFGC